MDSRLLNVLHDDPFEANFAVKYENETNFWSNGTDSAMSLQLSETLHGILPIAEVTAGSATDIYEHAILDATEDYQLEHHSIDNVTDCNALIYEDFNDEHLMADSIGAIEIVTVDPNANTDDDDSELDELHVYRSVINAKAKRLEAAQEHVEYDNQSLCSDYTFRTRTDSSSIGDYESHTSDYDDDDDDDEEEYLHEDDDVFVKEEFVAKAITNVAVEQQKNDKKPVKVEAEIETEVDALLPTDDEILLNTSLTTLVVADSSKNRTISTNTIDSDVEGFGVPISATIFDFANFITKDDDDAILNDTIVETTTTTTATTLPQLTTKTQTVINTQKIPTKIQNQNAGKIQVIPFALQDDDDDNDSDADSDIIVDVETVEPATGKFAVSKKIMPSIEIKAAPQLEQYDVSYVDNVKGDPSWSPGRDTKSKKHDGKETKIHATQNKLQNGNILKRKCGNNARMQQNNKPTSKKSDKLTSKIQHAAENGAHTEATRRVGVGQSSKNLAFLKYERENIPQQMSQCLSAADKVAQQNSNTNADKSTQQETPTEPQQNIKRKLNLEEYKKRRGDNSINNQQTNQQSDNNNKTSEITKQTQNTAPTSKPRPPVPTPAHKHSDEVISIVRSLKQQQTCPTAGPALDPITVAKNKVLRMQQLKRAQQLKILDSTVSAKVPRVTKLLPLQDLIKDSYQTSQNKAQQLQMPPKCQHPDYEEIIIVSASCNTEISIPPSTSKTCRQRQMQPLVNEASRSLLKSSTLLYNISNTIQKVQATEQISKINTNSLIASIQNVVVQQTLPKVVTQANNTTTQPQSIITSPQEQQQHGEDKIIMHLPKNRAPKRTACIATQTDFQPEFLAFFPALIAAHTTAPTATTTTIPSPRRRNYRKRSADCSGSDRESPEINHTNHAAVVCNGEAYASSLECDAASVSGSGGVGARSYSSRSSRRHRSSVSSSYSDEERVSRQRQRQRRASYKKHQKRAKKYTHSRSRSRSCSTSSSASSCSSASSMSQYSGRSRSRSRSPWQGRRSACESSNRNRFVDRNVSQPAVEERRIVYVGRIEQETTKEMLRRKFLAYGPINQITIHYKDTGMKYGFVTYERAQDAFRVIDSGCKDQAISMYDISFGGRRAFCRANYADLDNAGINTYHSYVFPKAAAPTPVAKEDSFEALLQQMKAKLSATKAASNNQI